MSGEVDTYLFERLQYVVNTKQEYELLTNLYGLRKLFSEMKDLLGESAFGNIISVEDWPKVRREKLYHVNNLLTEWQAITKTLGLVHTPNSISAAYYLSKKLNKVKRDLKGGDGPESKHLTNSNIQTNNEESSPHKIPLNYRWSSRYVDPEKVYGLDAKAMSLERELTGSQTDFKAIGIVGMPGIGKTTLAQLLFNESKVKGYFLPRIWVSMSKQPDQEDNYNVKDIVERILRSLAVEEETIELTFEQSGLEGLIFALRMQLTNKKYLVVLDDVEKDFGKLNSGSSVINGEMMKKLEYGLPKGFGGTVIMTSREEKVVEGMVGEENMHKMVPLPDSNSCWLIFKDWVKKDLKEFPKNLEGFEDEIVRKCGGLPLSAKLMGQIVNQSLKAPPTENQNPVVEQPLIETENQVTLEQPIETEIQEMQTAKEPVNQQPQLIENQQLTETESEKLTEQLEISQLIETKMEIQPPETIDNLEIENREPMEQPELETENLEVQPENEETTEDLQPIEKLKMDNQKLTETENEELTKQQAESQLGENETEDQLPQDDQVPEDQQPIEQQQKETDNEELIKQQAKSQLRENETEDQPSPQKDNLVSENEQPIEQLQKETENEERIKQQAESQLRENKTEDQPSPQKDNLVSEIEQPIEQLQKETENEELIKQQAESQLRENETEDQPSPQKDNLVSENEQPIEQLQKETENEELTKHWAESQLRGNETEDQPPPQEDGQVSEDEQPKEQLQTETENEQQAESQLTEDQLSPPPEDDQAVEDHQLQTTTELTEQSEEPQLTEIENWEVIEKPETDN